MIPRNRNKQGSTLACQKKNIKQKLITGNDDFLNTELCDVS